MAEQNFFQKFQGWHIYTRNLSQSGTKKQYKLAATFKDTKGKHRNYGEQGLVNLYLNTTESLDDTVLVLVALHTMTAQQRKRVRKIATQWFNRGTHTGAQCERLKVLMR